MYTNKNLSFIFCLYLFFYLLSRFVTFISSLIREINNIYRYDSKKGNKAEKKTAIESNPANKPPIIEEVKPKKGAKVSPDITKVIKRKRKLERYFLELYRDNCLNVGPTAGLTTLARYLYRLELFRQNNGKPLSVNTIRQDLTEIAEEINYQNPRSNKN